MPTRISRVTSGRGSRADADQQQRTDERERQANGEFDPGDVGGKFADQKLRVKLRALSDDR